MIVTIFILIILSIIYKRYKLEISYSVFLFMIIFPYRSIMIKYFPSLDKIMEILLIIELFFLIASKKKKNLNKDTLIFIIILIIDTLLYSLSVKNICFLIINPDTRFYIGVYILTTILVNNIKSKKIFLEYCKIIVINNLLMLSLGIIGIIFFNFNSIHSFDNRNIFSLQICLGFFLCKYLYYISNNKLYKIISLILFFSIFFMKSTTIIMIIILSLILELLLFLLKKNNIINKYRRILKLFFWAIFLLGIIGIILTINGDVIKFDIVKNILKLKGYYDLTRITIWQEAWNTFCNNYIIGIGADNFRAQNVGYSYATHNDYLMFLTNYGMIGFLAFSYITYCNLKFLYKIRNIHLFQIGASIFLCMYVYIYTHNLTNYIIFWYGLTMVKCSVKLENEHSYIIKK